MERIENSFRAWNRRRASGNAAIEFALIAPVFFLLLMAIVETGMVYFAGATLENGLETAARMIRTGRASGVTQSQFRQTICDNINTFMSCDASYLYIDVRAFNGFSGASYPAALDANGNLNPNLNSYQLGGACKVVLVRAFYTWTLFTPGFAQYFANMGNNTRLITSSVAFRNEPYGTAPC